MIFNLKIKNLINKIEEEELLFRVFNNIAIISTISCFLFFLFFLFLFSKDIISIYFFKIVPHLFFFIILLSFIQFFLIINSEKYFYSKKNSKSKRIYTLQLTSFQIIIFLLVILFSDFNDITLYLFTQKFFLLYFFIFMIFLFFILYSFFTKENTKYIVSMLFYIFIIIILGVTNVLISQESDLNYFYFFEDKNFNCEKVIERKLLGIDSPLNCYFKSSENKKDYIYYVKDKEERYLFTNESYFSLRFNNEIDSKNYFYVYELNIQNINTLNFNNPKNKYFYINKSNKNFSNIENLKVYINNKTNVTNRTIYSNAYVSEKEHNFYEIILISNENYFLLGKEKYLNARNILIGAFIFFFAFLVFLIEITKVLKINILIFKNNNKK